MYAWAPLGCGNYAPNFFGTSVPEVVEVRENPDGTVTLTVNAVCDMVICGGLRQRLRAEGEGLCERDEGCDQISSRLKSEHRSQSVIKICFIPKKG